MTNPAKAAASVRPCRKRKKHWLQRDWRLYLMLLIPIVWYILFCRWRGFKLLSRSTTCSIPPRASGFGWTTSSSFSA